MSEQDSFSYEMLETAYTEADSTEEFQNAFIDIFSDKSGRLRIADLLTKVAESGKEDRFYELMDSTGLKEDDRMNEFYELAVREPEKDVSSISGRMV